MAMPSHPRTALTFKRMVSKFAAQDFPPIRTLLGAICQTLRTAVSTMVLLPRPYGARSACRMCIAICESGTLPYRHADEEVSRPLDRPIAPFRGASGPD